MRANENFHMKMSNGVLIDPSQYSTPSERKKRKKMEWQFHNILSTSPSFTFSSQNNNREEQEFIVFKVEDSLTENVTSFNSYSISEIPSYKVNKEKESCACDKEEEEEYSEPPPPPYQMNLSFILN